MAAQLHFGTGDSVTFGTTGAVNSATASFSKSALSNVQVGDLLVAWIHNQYGSGAATITPPSGWTQYGAAMGSPSVGASRVTSFYYYPINTSADITSLASTLTWTFSISARVGCVVARATGVDLSSIQDSAATAFSSATASGSFAISGITTVNPTTLVVGGYFHENSASTSWPATTSFMTDFQEYLSDPTGVANGTSGNTGAAMGYQYLSAAGATGTMTATLNNTATTLGGELVAFTALNTVPPTNPTIVGTPTTFISNPAVTSFTIATPTGLQDGDALILALSGQTPVAASDYQCSGWARISQPFEVASGGHRIIAFYALPVPTAASVTQTSFTFASTDSANGGRVAAEMFIVRGAELSSLTTVISTYASSGQAVTIPDMTPTVDNGLLLTAYNTSVTNVIDYTVSSGPSGMTQQNFLVTSTGSVSKTTLAVYQQNVGTSLITGKTITWAATPSQSSGVGIVIRPKGVFDSNDGRAIRYTDVTDTLAPARLYYTSATDTLSTPLELRPVPTGYTSVSAMLATSHFSVAHRGGSFDWPEMSLHAYTQSVFWGMGALELSLARTSDGVWFGMHDASLDRTSLNSGGGSGTTLVASSMTWAQVQTHQIQYPNVANSSSLPQPYMRWEELMAAYYGTHVIFVDPKYASTYVSEILDMMDAMPGTPTTQFVGKSYGVTGNTANTTGFPHFAAARGYKNWGYFYQADAANFAAYQGRYDILGMDYTADAPTWSTIMSYGKPVIGHIVPSAAAAATAFGYGAVGVMASGVQEAITRTPDPSQS